MTYMPMTVEECHVFAARCKEDGYPELAEIFERIGAKIAAFNERSPFTVEEIRKQIGEEAFLEILSQSP